MKKQNKTLLNFILVVAAAGLVGGLIGFFSGFFQTSLAHMLLKVKTAILVSAPYCLLILGILGLGIMMYYWYRGKQLFAEKGGEDEVLDTVTHYATIAIGVSGVAIVLDLIWFCFILVARNAYLISNIELTLGIFLFLGLCFGCIFLQRALINLLRKVNPEKQGDALDLNFSKKWMDSCDEQEKLAGYKAAYTAYTRSTFLFCGLFIALTFTNFVINLGIAPFLVLGVIWIFQSATYMVESIKSK